MSALQRSVVNEARLWLGTRFHHQGRVKATEHHQGGCDCIGLIIGVAKNLELISPITGKPLTLYDQQGYSRYPDGVALQQAMAACLPEIAVTELEPGDILLLKFEENPQHVAIVSDYGDKLGIIHCYAQARKVVEHGLDISWQQRIVRAYRLIAVAEER